jgi:predicted dehydrogenase
MRFGLFGTGPWAHLAHAPGLAAHKDVEFVGVWGRNATKAAELADQYGAKAYGDVDALIADVDAIAVALPPDIQAPIALQAARAGKHLLLDKPVAFDPAVADEIAAATRDSGVASAVFFTRRFLPALAAFIEETAATGGWVEGRVDHSGTIYNEGNPFGASKWRQDSGGLWDVGPHALALVLPILGPVVEVTAMTGKNDMAHVLLRHADDAVSTLTLSVGAPPAAGREAAVFYGDSGIVSAPQVEFDAVTAFGVALDQLVTAAGGGPRPAMDVAFGAEVTRILAAAAQASETGHSVKLNG